MTLKTVVYTAIFGDYEGLVPQPAIPGVDYICFSDKYIRSRSWRVERVEPRHDDPGRSARVYKVLPHEVLDSYDTSIWMDANYLIVGDVRELLSLYLEDANIAVFDHGQTKSDPRRCVYEEYEALMSMGKATGRYKDDPAVLTRQIERYRRLGYPPQNGLVFAAVLVRRHHDPTVIRTMKTWWSEIEQFSRRDQLSFNYACWKERLDFAVIDGDLRNNRYFYMVGHHRKSYKAALLRYRLRKLFGYVKPR